jgi:hypothetical protein
MSITARLPTAGDAPQYRSNRVRARGHLARMRGIPRLSRFRDDRRSTPSRALSLHQSGM